MAIASLNAVKNRMIFVKVAAAVGALSLGPSDVAYTSENMMQRFTDWQVSKDNSGQCTVSQTVLGRRTGSALLAVHLTRISNLEELSEDKITVVFQVPNGVSLVDGIAYRHRSNDSSGIGMQWQYCDRQHCTAAGIISSSEFDRWIRGATLIVGYRPLPGSRLLNVPLSLRGLTAAWRASAVCVR